jgi:MoxR-like ATPase
MRNNVLDELIADYAGMVAATGGFRASWFLRFLGLEDYPRYRPGGRLDLYRGDPPLSDEAFGSLHALIRSAAETLERFGASGRTLSERALVLSALASLRLDDLAAPDGSARLERALVEIRGRLGWQARSAASVQRVIE